ncbi:MAG: precorrin-6y C5,15-methyltransferase (decarboxylating) subunit CbiE [Pseudomonadales bacterium]
MSAFKIHIIGLGVTDTAELSKAATKALASCERVLGSARQLEVVAGQLSGQQTEQLPELKNLPVYLADLIRDGVSSLALLASGDPLYYGIGRWFSKNFSDQQLHFYPAVSSIQMACHQLGLSLQDVEVLSLHGRPLEKIRSKLKARQTLVILTDKNSSPQALARECIAAGFDESQLSVCEALGYPQQRISRYSADEMLHVNIDFDPLHVTVIETRGDGGVLPEFPGIPDASYVTDKADGRGMLTKRDVRLSILSLMQPANNEVIWDIGAGCGGVSVELAYWNETTQVVAIEHHDERLKCLNANRDKFGLMGNLTVVQGRAPEALEELPAPDKIFIGGSDGSLPELLEQCWSKLPAQGLLVASAVTEQSKQQLLAFYQQRETVRDSRNETLQVAVSHGTQLAGQLVYRPSLPVTLFKFSKRK